MESDQSIALRKAIDSLRTQSSEHATWGDEQVAAKLLHDWGTNIPPKIVKKKQKAPKKTLKQQQTERKEQQCLSKEEIRLTEDIERESNEEKKKMDTNSEIEGDLERESKEEAKNIEGGESEDRLIEIMCIESRKKTKEKNLDEGVKVKRKRKSTAGEKSEESRKKKKVVKEVNEGKGIEEIEDSRAMTFFSFQYISPASSNNTQIVYPSHDEFNTAIEHAIAFKYNHAVISTQNLINILSGRWLATDVSFNLRCFFFFIYKYF